MQLDPNEHDILQLEVGATGPQLRPHRFTAVVVDAGGGADRIIVSRVGGLSSTRLTLDGGPATTS